MNNPYVHNIFTMLLIKQIFEKNKSLRVASKSRMRFWPRITPGVVKGQKMTWIPPFGKKQLLHVEKLLIQLFLFVVIKYFCILITLDQNPLYFQP